MYAEDVPKTVGSLCATGDDQHKFVVFIDDYILDCREVSGHRKVSLDQVRRGTILPSSEDVKKRCLAACTIAPVNCNCSVCRVAPESELCVVQ